MLSQNPRGDLFAAALPAPFFAPEICAKYDEYLSGQESPFLDTAAFINEGIMSFSLTGLEQENTEMMQHMGDGYAPPVNNYTGFGSSISLPTSKVIEYRMRLSDGNLNYFIMYELFMYWYKADFKKQNSFMLPVSTYSLIGEPIFNMVYENSYYKALGGLELGYASYAGDFKEFTATFNFTSVSITPIIGAGPDRYMPRT